MENSPPRHVQSLLTGCSNQRQVRTSPRPIISQGITFKSRPPSSSYARRSVRLASCLDRRRGRPAFSPAPAGASPGPASAAVLLRSRLSNRSFRSPCSDVFFYSGHPTIFPASFISSMDSLQSFISSFTQLLLEFASNSATSALPLLRSANVQHAPWLLPLTFTSAMLIRARL
ncbi:hypothetical protein CRENBAI_004355 [Crenichthys baileyi]|uniref:Uncharacterized protein n=1 Tax=Crenichthys baileyi TaxID=28760 RepID=A0AAV9RSI7_9TELE